MNSRLAVAAVLCAQAVLLLAAPGLLPVWTDELFTLQTVGKSAPAIVEAVRHDIHPPLYYLMAHVWPWHGIAGLRAFSALWALAATAILWSFWRDRAPRLAFLLFAFSPCLLLYGRMARSYAMQTALALLAVALLERWMRDPRAPRWAVTGGAATVALLYTHYAPGGAILLGFLAVAWKPLGARRVAAFAAAVAVAYAPWALLSVESMRRWGGQASFSATYMLTGSPILEHFVKLGFGAVSLAIGETFPGGLAAAGPAGVAARMAWRAVEAVSGGLDWDGGRHRVPGRLALGELSVCAGAAVVAAAVSLSGRGGRRGRAALDRGGAPSFARRFNRALFPPGELPESRVCRRQSGKSSRCCSGTPVRRI